MKIQKIVALLLIASCYTAAEVETLTVLTWEEYMDPELVSRFEQEQHVKLDFIYYENDEIRDQIMAETAGYGFDVILVDEAELPSYIREQWLQPLDSMRIPHLADHGRIWLETIPEAEGYAVPYGWGTYGITYRTDLVETPPTHWADLFEPDNELAGFIQMSSQAAELLAIALLANGEDPFEDDLAALKQAEALLKRQKSSVVAFELPDLEADETLLSQGIAKAVMTYSSDSLFLQDEYEDLAFVSPAEGNIYWIDLWSISNHSKNVNLAHRFLDFVLQADVAAQNVTYHYSATFSEKAIALLPENLRNNKTIYPSSLNGVGSFPTPTKNTIRSLMRIINSLDLD